MVYSGNLNSHEPFAERINKFDWVRQMAGIKRVLILDFQDICSGCFGPTTLAVILRNHGYDATVAGDRNIEEFLRDKGVFRKILNTYKPDVVGLSVMTPYADYIEETASFVKDNCGNIPVIAGGYHPTIFKGKVFEDAPGVDYIVLGDGDAALPLLLEYLDGKSGVLPEGCVKRGGAGSENVLPQAMRHLGQTPYPHEDVIHPICYGKLRPFFLGHGSLPSPSRYALFSRGCPFNCTFCKIVDDNGFRSRVRSYPVPVAINVLKDLKLRYKLKGVALLDDNFSIDLNWANEFCDELAKEELDISWWAQIRGNLSDFSLMEKMKRTGCKVVTIPVESGNERIRNSVMGKGVSNDQLMEAFSIAKKLGFVIQSTMMLASPTETEGEMRESIEFFKKLAPDFAGIVFTVPLPGTALYKEYKDNIAFKEYRDFDISRQLTKIKDDTSLFMHLHKIPKAVLLREYENLVQWCSSPLSSMSSSASSRGGIFGLLRGLLDFAKGEA